MLVQWITTGVLFVGLYFFLAWIWKKLFGPKKETPSERAQRLAALKEESDRLNGDVEVTKEMVEATKEVDKKEKVLDSLDQKLQQEKE